MSPSSSDSEEAEAAYKTVSSLPPKRSAGRTKFRETRHPVYKGVRRRNNGKWVCEVREPNKKSRIWLGTFPTVEMAARAHDVAAMALRGRAACLNFANSATLLPVPRSADPGEIRRAAADAAEAFRPSLAAPGTSAAADGAEAIPPAEADPFYAEDLNYFGMQGYFDMAEGMLIDPPQVLIDPPPVIASASDDDGNAEEVSLWSN